MKTFYLTVSLLSMMLAGFAAQAASFAFVKKETGKAGDVTYTYSYACINRAQGMFSVVAKNDEEAHKLAEPKARLVCEE